jgi:hypothetical protein
MEWGGVLVLRVMAVDVSASCQQLLDSCYVSLRRAQPDALLERALQQETTCQQSLSEVRKGFQYQECMPF